MIVGYTDTLDEKPYPTELYQIKYTPFHVMAKGYKTVAIHDAHEFVEFLEGSYANNIWEVHRIQIDSDSVKMHKLPNDLAVLKKIARHEVQWPLKARKF